MLSKFINWIKPLPDAKNPLTDEKQIAKQYKHWRIRMFLGMYVGYVMYYFTRKNLTYAAPSIMRKFNISMLDLGIVSSTSYVAYGIGKFISGLLADKCNIRTFMAIGLIGSSLVNLFFGFLPSLPLLTLFWGINGGLQSMGFPPVAKGLVYWFSPKERATKWTLWSSSHTVGTSLGGIATGICIAIGGWHAVFYIPGIVGIVTGTILLFTLTDKPSSIGLPPIDVYHKDTMPVKRQSGLSHWQLLTKYVFANPFLWSLAIAYIFIYYIRFATLDWSTVFMETRGIENARAAFLLSTMPFVGTLGGISSGWIADRFFKGRCTPVNLIYLFCLIFCLLGMYHFIHATTPTWIMVLFLSLVGFFVDGPQNLVGGVQTSRLTVQESVSAACGFTGMFGYGGAFMSGFGVALLVAKWGWHGFFVSCIASCILAMFFISLTWKKEAVLNKKSS
ncbi:MFS transporter [Candidatus Endomicrobiellum agilis]|uniref:MFS transporter n=1 Tax=Candidatus Endomicrobiellum agilis TaxID=3238957 RepID=UPI003587EEAD|nr:MFS transporter [Endomicrobium sp.]MCA6084852.1 MFS transporter [Endomicrobium sp.]